MERYFEVKKGVGVQFKQGMTFVFVMIGACVSSAAPPTEADIVAATYTSEYLSYWLRDLDKKPKSVGIFSIQVNAPLDKSYIPILESELTKHIAENSSVKLSTCLECRTPQVKVKGDRLVVSQGAPDLEMFKANAKKLEVESFLTLDVYRTKLFVVSQVTLYQAATAEIISAEQFKVPSIDSSTSLQVAFLGGVGTTFGQGPTENSKTPPLSGMLMVLEELGFGKGGLTFGAVSGQGSRPMMGFVLPTIGWRGRFGPAAVSSLFSFGLGYGFSGSRYGVATRLAYDIYLGSFTMIGIGGEYTFPLSKNNYESSTDGFVGLHLGFVLGR